MLTNSSDDESEYGLDYILLFRLIVWGYVGLILSLFGIVGNIITILVLTSSSMRTTSTNMYLTALSCSNIFFLLIFIPSYSIRYLLGYKVYMSNQPPFAFEILLQRLPTTPVYNTILLSIIYLTIALSMDRLILVKFPLKAKNMLTKRTTLITILLIYMFSIVYCIPYWLEQRYVPELKQCRLTKIGSKIHKYTRIYLYIPVVYVVPFLTLTFINITIIQYLIEKKRHKENLFGIKKRQKSGDYRITLMLVTVIIVFCLSQLPLLVLNAWYAIDPHGSYENLKFHILNSLGILLIVLNTSTNFLLYCFFGQKFRQTLIKFIVNTFPNHSKKLHQVPPNILPLQKQRRIPNTSSSGTTDNIAKTTTHTTFNETPSPLDHMPFMIFREESRLLLPYTLIPINDTTEHDKSESNSIRPSFEDENRLLVLKS